MSRRRPIPILSNSFIRSNLEPRNEEHVSQIVIQNVPSKKRFGTLILGILSIFAILHVLLNITFRKDFKSDLKIEFVTDKPPENDLILETDQKIEIKEPHHERCNYAAESIGGKIISIGDTEPYINKPSSALGRLLLKICVFCDYKVFANRILQPYVQPGECWAFKGSKGFAIISLYDKIFINFITIEHIPITLHPNNNLSSAPKEFTIKGLHDINDNFGVNFGTFIYNISLNPTQYFELATSSSIAFKLVKFEVKSNWGHKDYTCVYRIGVHGDIENH